MVFGAVHAVWLRRQAARGQTVSAPLFQFAFGVLLAPVAVLIAAAFVWRLVHGL